MARNYIILYKDEQTWDAWKDYCYATGVSRNSDFIKIYFNEEECEGQTEED